METRQGQQATPKKIDASVPDQIKQLEDELTSTKYNKRTQKHIGLVKAKLAKLKQKQELRRSQGKKGEGFSVRKSGDATVVLLGFPSVGKSSLLNKLTNANSPVAAYAFTTLDVIPGLLEYRHAKIQILDVPGVVRGAASGTGRGKEVLQVVRSADLVLILLDVFYPEHYEVLLHEVYDTGIRLDKTKPDVRIKKTPYGGIRIGKTVSLTMSDDTIKSIMMEFKLNNADILVRERIDEDGLIDVIEGGKIYLPKLVVVNKVDLADEQQIALVKERITPDLFVSAEEGLNIQELKEKIYEKLRLMPIYLKETGKKADLEVPMIIREGSMLRNVCERLHRDFVTKFKFARLWGTSVKFDGQAIRKLEHVVKHGDIIELHLR